MRQSIDYSLTANRAVLDLAARYREQFLFNIWRMGRNSIERGQRDTWTMSPAATAEGAGGGADVGDRRSGAARRRRQRAAGAVRYACSAIRRCATRGATCCPPTRPDFPTAITFVNALIRAGVDGPSRHRAVHRAGPLVSGRVARREDRAGVPAARARHVRAAGSPRRLPVPRRAADPAVRQRRLDAGLPDGRAGRSHPRGLRRAVRARARRTRHPGRTRHAARPTRRRSSSLTRATRHSGRSTDC